MHQISQFCMWSYKINCLIPINHYTLWLNFGFVGVSHALEWLFCYFKQDATCAYLLSSFKNKSRFFLYICYLYWCRNMKYNLALILVHMILLFLAYISMFQTIRSQKNILCFFCQIRICLNITKTLLILKFSFAFEWQKMSQGETFQITCLLSMDVHSHLGNHLRELLSNQRATY